MKTLASCVVQGKKEAATSLSRGDPVLAILLKFDHVPELLLLVSDQRHGSSV